jgi:thioredoxin-related protein
MRLLKFLFLSIIVLSCSKNHYTDTINYLNDIEDLDWENGKNVVIILSNRHCEYCVDKTVKFKEENLDIDKLHVIFSVLKKEESMLDIYGVNLRSNKNYISDDNQAYRKNIINDMPLVLLIEDGNISESVELHPDNLESTYSMILGFLNHN